MSVPGVWQLIGAYIQCSCNGQQWSDCHVQCPDRITTTGCTSNCINDSRRTGKHMSNPGVWKLIGADPVSLLQLTVELTVNLNVLIVSQPPVVLEPYRYHPPAQLNT